MIQYAMNYNPAAFPHRLVVGLISGLFMLAMTDVARGHGAGEEQPSFDAATTGGGESGEVGMFISEQLSRQLEGVRGLLDKNQNKEAITRLEAMEARSNSYNRYENAILHQTLAYAYATVNDYPKAAETFEEALSFKALPREAMLSVMQNLGQLYIVTESYTKGIAVLEDWMRRAKPREISPQMRVLLGNAYFHQRDYAKAVAQLNKAITAVDHPDKSWLQLLAGVDQQWGHYNDMADVLQQAISVYPGEKSFWQQLSAAYRQLHQDKKAAAVLALACNTGLCDGNDKIYLARLYLYIGAPVKSVHLIQASLKDGTLSGVAEDWQLLAQSWQQAREPDKAAAAYREAAKRSTDSGDADFHLGQIYVQQARWQAAADAFTRALKKGKLSSPGRTHLMLGVARYYLGQPDTALQSLKAAAGYKDTEIEARRWLQHVRPAVTAAADKPSS